MIRKMPSVKAIFLATAAVVFMHTMMLSQSAFAQTDTSVSVEEETLSNADIAQMTALSNDSNSFAKILSEIVRKNPAKSQSATILALELRPDLATRILITVVRARPDLVRETIRTVASRSPNSNVATLVRSAILAVRADSVTAAEIIQAAAQGSGTSINRIFLDLSAANASSTAVMPVSLQSIAANLPLQASAPTVISNSRNDNQTDTIPFFFLTSPAEINSSVETFVSPN